MSQQSVVHPESWKIAYVARSEPEAIIVAGRLENQGIETFVHREVVSGNARGVYLDPLGAVSVLVHPSAFEQASTILDQVLSDNSLDEEDENQSSAPSE